MSETSNRTHRLRKTVKALIFRSRLYAGLTVWQTRKQQKRTLATWKQNGKPMPPPHLIKQAHIREIADRFQLETLVETGTFYGDMVEAMRPHFKTIYSIELSKALYRRAACRFHRYPNIHITQGDSAIELKAIVAHLDQPALFWLDGHYSDGITARGAQDTPIYEELIHIFNSPVTGHAILIDDARCFGAYPTYPSKDEISSFIRKHVPDCILDEHHDCIRILPNKLTK